MPEVSGVVRLLTEDQAAAGRRQAPAWLATLAKSPSSAASSLFERAVYGSDSPLGSVWTPELVEQVDRDMLVDFHGREITPGNMTVFMIGDVGIEEATRVVERSLGKWRADADSGRKPIGAAPPARPRVILVDQPEAPQSTIYAGHALPPYDAETSTELYIMNGVFGGGFESRINMNLREDKHWSYGMRSGIQQNTSGDQYIAVSGSVQADRTMESLLEIMKEFEELVTTRPASETEVSRVKINRMRSLPGTFSTNRGFLASIMTSDSYGLPYDYAETRGERIAAVTLDAVNARARSVIDPGRLTWVIVGDLAKFLGNRLVDFIPTDRLAVTQRALALDPVRYGAVLGYALLLEARGRLADAAAVLDRFLPASPWISWTNSMPVRPAASAASRP